jgi:hypothetical protein
MPERRVRLTSRLAGAALLGAATVLVPKADPADHWATPLAPVGIVAHARAPDVDQPLPGGARIVWPVGLTWRR